MMTVRKMMFAWKYRRALWKYRKLLAHRRQIAGAALAGVAVVAFVVIGRAAGKQNPATSHISAQ